MGQVDDTLVSQILMHYESENWDKVMVLFTDFAKKDTENAEVFYWLRASDNEILRPKVLLVLAKCYSEQQNASKAVVMYRELVMKCDPTTSILLDAARDVINLGDVRVTQLIYEKVLQKEPTNVVANMFLGNFFYLKGEKEFSRLDYHYSQKKKHTRMEYAEYRKQQQAIFETYYDKAKSHLLIVMSVKKFSDEIENTLTKINQLEEKLK